MSCPVPPWNPGNIVRLSEYLGISQAKLTALLGISYSALRAWIDGRSQTISPKTLSRLKKFESRIPAFREKAEVHFQELAEKDERKKSRLSKPWAVNRIRSFMHTWGMTQVELAIFAGVSYDTVTSWSRGRRRLVRRETATHMELAEKAALQRGFSKGSPDEKDNPWSKMRQFLDEKKVEKTETDIPKTLTGDYAFLALEEGSENFRLGKKTDSLIIEAGKKRDIRDVSIKIGAKTLDFTGHIRRLGGVRVLELESQKDDPLFFSSRAGCITPSKNALRVSLWSPGKVPVRFMAIPA